MTLASRAVVRPKQVVDLAFRTATLEDVFAAVESFDNRWTTGMVLRGQNIDGWKETFAANDPSVFVPMCGSHIVAYDWKGALDRLASPCFMVGTGGYPVWGSKALYLYSVYKLKGTHVFKR